MRRRGSRASWSVRPVVLAAVVSVLAPAAVRAEPYFMVRAGAKCNDCHTNLTGGGKRTAFAQIHSRDILHDYDFLPIPAGAKAFNGELNSWVSIGGDLRTRSTTVFTDDPDADGRVDNNRAFRDDVDSSDLDVRQFTLYGQIDLWPDVLTLYADENFNGGATNREAMAIIRGFLPWDTYVKGGRLYPTFGLRVQDDDAFIRRRSGFTFENPDAGAEIGFAPGPLFVASSVTNGQGGDGDFLATINAYSVFTELPVVRNALAGGSFARQSDKRNVGGFYAGTNLWKFTGLVEFDIITDNQVSTEGRRDQYAAYSELHFLAFDWLDFRGTYEFVKVSNDNDETRWTIGAEPFINKFLQPRIQYRINNGPESDPQLNRAELWAELHLFF
jgi:hypothetical protein